MRMRIQYENLSMDLKTKMINTFVETVGKNKYIPHKVLVQQLFFLTYPSEELLFGGAAGGGKSDALLMAALQYVDKPDYSALLLRRTYQDLSQPNAIMDRAKRWLHPFVKNGIVNWNNQTKTFTFPTGSTLSFGYLSHDNDLDQYQGSELQFVGFDELTQFTEKQYTYLHSRLRKLEKSEIPIRMRAGTNPGGKGHSWVKKRFIVDDSPQPFIQSLYTDNVHLDKQYGNQLDKLDPLTKAQLKHGDWNAEFNDGLLVNRETLENQVIQQEVLDSWRPSFSVIGIDPASTGEDNFAISLLTYFNNGYYVLTDLDSTQSSNPELLVRNFIERNKEWNISFINFEREPGSSPHYALEYWRNVLSDLMGRYGFTLIDTPASQTGSKYMRATPHANLVRNGKLYFNERLLSVGDGLENPIRRLFNQYVYVHPDKHVMKEYPSPDELDSVGYAYIGVNNVLQKHTGTRVSMGNRIG